jgi:transposase
LKDRRALEERMQKGESAARVFKRARVLLLVDAGWPLSKVAEAVGVSKSSVARIRERYEQVGLEGLRERPRPGKPRRLSASEETRIVAMTCGAPPAGRARWTVRLIAEEAMKRKLVPQVGRETIRVLLQNHELRPWREKNVERRGARR